MKDANTLHDFNVTSFQNRLSENGKQLIRAQDEITVLEKIRFCIDEILQTVFYAGKRHSDQIISNDSLLDLSPRFWETLHEIALFKYRDTYQRIEDGDITLNAAEKNF